MKLDERYTDYKTLLNNKADVPSEAYIDILSLD